jgi:hypothetical protein
MAKKKQTLPDIKNQDPLEPINIAELGSNSDPCFGIGYDLSTKECKLCGDSELCAFKMSQNMNITRKELEQKNQYRHGWYQEIHPRLDSERERKKRSYYQNR